MKTEQERRLTGLAADSHAGGGYPEKTLWRQQRCWERRRERHQQRLWDMIFHHGLDGPLQQERKSSWKALALLELLFHILLRLEQSWVKLNWYEKRFLLNQKKRFGASSEKTDEEQLKLTLFNEAEETTDPAALELRYETVTIRRRKQSGKREE
ncbi:hypothetical protein CULT_40055 [[Clostridium] ultunense Esp]|nr:hypothetical protein CULT_40055 [[Clostridium] ultunense Esp]